MPTVLHAKPYDRFVEIKNNLRRKKLHITNQDPIFLETNVAIEIN